MKSACWRRLKDSRFLLAPFRRDQSGSYAILAAFVMLVPIGTAGLGTEAGLWLYKTKVA